MQADYSEEVEANRKEKDSFFGSAEESPIRHEERHGFTGLKYFPPNSKYAVRAKLQRYDYPEVIVMATSKGTEQRFHKVGYFEFEINGTKVRLQGYKSAEREDNDLFIPFRDKTSGRESYGAARYLDLELHSTDEYQIDFNYAYNPYCAYSDDYICPLPPRENWLEVGIRAGEKKYRE